MQMNRFFLTLFIGLFAATTAWAQPSKGSVLIGGNVGFASINQDGSSVTSIQFSPSAAFFTSNRFAVGGSVAVEVLAGDADYSSVAVGPLARYYFNTNGPTRFFGQGSLAWENVDFGGFGSQSGFGFGLGFGLDYFINPNVAFEAFLGYDFRNYEDTEDSSSTIGVTFGVAAFIGGGK